jgi:hypothetical protein
MPTKSRKLAKRSAVNPNPSTNVFATFTVEGRHELLKSIACKHELFGLLPSSTPNQKNQVSWFVVQLAQSKNIRSHLTRLDQIASTFTVLVGDPAKRDDIDDLIVAMGKSHVLDPVEVAQLTAAHLAEKHA